MKKSEATVDMSRERAVKEKSKNKNGNAKEGKYMGTGEE